MRINFIGLSCFLIENRKGFKILVDPFNGTPEWSLGPIFPRRFQGKPLGANIVLMSEPDADHAYAPGGWLQAAPHTNPGEDVFPGLNLQGTVVYEWNGDINIAWHYTVDGLRLLHLADNAHQLTRGQLVEMGKPDILFISAPKIVDGKALDVTRKNIAALCPKMVIWAHQIVPRGMPEISKTELLRSFFRRYFKKNASTNKGYNGPESFMSLCSVLENAYSLNSALRGEIVSEPFLEIDPRNVRRLRMTRAVLFTNMVARS